MRTKEQTQRKVGRASLILGIILVLAQRMADWSSSVAALACLVFLMVAMRVQTKVIRDSQRQGRY